MALDAFWERLGRRGGDAASGAPVDPVARRREAERRVRERATAEAVAFQEALADAVIATLGIASALTAAEAHLHLGRILAGSAGSALVDEVAGRLRQRRVRLGGSLPDARQLHACLCSPMLSVLVRRRLERTAGPDAADEPGDEDGIPV